MLAVKTNNRSVSDTSHIDHAARLVATAYLAVVGKENIEPSSKPLSADSSAEVCEPLVNHLIPKLSMDQKSFILQYGDKLCDLLLNALFKWYEKVGCDPLLQNIHMFFSLLYTTINDEFKNEDASKSSSVGNLPTPEVIAGVMLLMRELSKNRHLVDSQHAEIKTSAAVLYANLRSRDVGDDIAKSAAVLYANLRSRDVSLGDDIATSAAELRVNEVVAQAQQLQSSLSESHSDDIAKSAASLLFNFYDQLCQSNKKAALTSIRSKPEFKDHVSKHRSKLKVAFKCASLAVFCLTIVGAVVYRYMYRKGQSPIYTKRENALLKHCSILGKGVGQYSTDAQPSLDTISPAA